MNEDIIVECAQWIRNSRTHIPEIQTWVYYPNSKDIEWNDPGRAWFKSENTGSGAVSPLFEGRMAEMDAEKWGVLNKDKIET